jgi:hypothetical protein
VRTVCVKTALGIRVLVAPPLLTGRLEVAMERVLAEILFVSSVVASLGAIAAGGIAAVVLMFRNYATHVHEQEESELGPRRRKLALMD